MTRRGGRWHGLTIAGGTLLLANSLLLLLAGCGAAPAPPHGYHFAVEPGLTYDLTQGAPLEPSTHPAAADGGEGADNGAAPLAGPLVARLSGARLIFLGEIHDEPRSHAFQVRAIRALHESGRRVVVALEMFPPEADEALAAWSRGELDEPEFLDRSDWYDRWGFPWGYYRELFLLFRELGLPLRGINVTREQRRAVREGDLPTEIEAEVGALDLSLLPHREYLAATLNAVGHGGGLGPGSPMFTAYHRVQVLWDQVMGRRAARIAMEEPESVVAVLIGSGHLAHGLGANLRAAREAPGLPQVSLIDRVVEPEDLDASGRYPLPLGLAGLARIYLDDPGRRRIPVLRGVALSDGAKGVEIKGTSRFAHGSSKGFQKGDIILSLNGQPFTSATRLRLAYESQDPEGIAEIVVARLPQRGANSEEGTETEVPGPERERVTITIPLKPHTR